MATIQRSKAQTKRLKPSKAVSQVRGNAAKPLLEGASIQHVHGRHLLIATDGRIAVRLPVEKNKTGEEITEGYIPAQALPHIEQRQFELTKEMVVVGRALGRSLGGEEWAEGEPLMQFARIEPMKASDAKPEYPVVSERWPAKPKRTLVINLDSRLISRLAAALATDALSIEVDLDRVEPIEEGVTTYESPLTAFKYGVHERPKSGPDGLIMPMRGAIEAKKT